MPISCLFWATTTSGGAQLIYSLCTGCLPHTLSPQSLAYRIILHFVPKFNWYLLPVCGGGLCLLELYEQLVSPVEGEGQSIVIYFNAPIHQFSLL